MIIFLELMRREKREELGAKLHCITYYAGRNTTKFHSSLLLFVEDYARGEKENPAAAMVSRSRTLR